MEKGTETDIRLDEKFAPAFEEIYFDKILDIMEEQGGDTLFSFTGEDN